MNRRRRHLRSRRDLRKRQFPAVLGDHLEDFKGAFDGLYASAGVIFGFALAIPRHKLRSSPCPDRISTLACYSAMQNVTSGFAKRCKPSLVFEQRLADPLNALDAFGPDAPRG